MLYMGFTNEDDLGANDEQLCRDLYLENEEAIKFVKSHLMPFSQGVDEARHFVEQARQNDETNKVGDILDPELEQDTEECQDTEEEIHPDFAQLNPNELEVNDNLKQIRQSFRQIEIKSADDRLGEARHLDKFQKKALHVAIQFAMDVAISNPGKENHPTQEHHL